MFKNKRHKFFCMCEICKAKRRTSSFYMGSLFSLIIILVWQVFLTLFFVSRFNVFLILVLVVSIIIGFFRIIF